MKKFSLIFISVLSLLLVIGLCLTLFNTFKNIGSESDANNSGSPNDSEQSDVTGNVNPSKRVLITVNYNQITQEGEAYYANLYNQVEHYYSEGEEYEIIHPDYSSQGYFIRGDGRATGTADNNNIIEVEYYPCGKGYQLNKNENGTFYIDIYHDNLVTAENAFPIRITNNTSEVCDSFVLNAVDLHDEILVSCNINEFVINPGESIAIWIYSGSLSGRCDGNDYYSYIKPLNFINFIKSVSSLPRG